MCDFENGFILCTCEPSEKTIIHNKNSRRYKNSPQAKIAGYRWSLAHFVGTFEPMMEGMYEPPSQDLGKGLTAEWVLLHLNFEKCFDFDYTPLEGDNLTMRSEDRWQYMSFIFRAGKWTIDRYDGFSVILEQQSAGKIMPLPTQ